eukprot:Rhum_TRINITY_DN15092_c15_g1::Rhum_TRINITY_DN15092_c15_g1_i1::g.137705::m.137705
MHRLAVILAVLIVRVVVGVRVDVVGCDPRRHRHSACARRLRLPHERAPTRGVRLRQAEACAGGSGGELALQRQRLAGKLQTARLLQVGSKGGGEAVQRRDAGLGQVADGADEADETRALRQPKLHDVVHFHGASAALVSEQICNGLRHFLPSALQLVVGASSNAGHRRRHDRRQRASFVQQRHRHIVCPLLLTLTLAPACARVPHHVRRRTKRHLRRRRNKRERQQLLAVVVRQRRGDPFRARKVAVVRVLHLRADWRRRRSGSRTGRRRRRRRLRRALPLPCVREGARRGRGRLERLPEEGADVRARRAAPVAQVRDDVGKACGVDVRHGAVARHGLHVRRRPLRHGRRGLDQAVRVYGEHDRLPGVPLHQRQHRVAHALRRRLPGLGPHGQRGSQRRDGLVQSDAERLDAAQDRRGPRQHRLRLEQPLREQLAETRLHAQVRHADLPRDLGCRLHAAEERRRVHGVDLAEAARRVQVVADELPRLARLRLACRGDLAVVVVLHVLACHPIRPLAVSHNVQVARRCALPRRRPRTRHGSRDLPRALARRHLLGIHGLGVRVASFDGL